MSAPSSTVPTAVRRDRAVGAVVAAAAGDALGAPHEFGPPLPAERTLVMSGGGPFGWAPGEWTDDTQQAALVLAALATGLTGDDLVAAVDTGFRGWYGDGPVDVGGQTRAVLSQAVHRGVALTGVAAAHAAADPDRAGNGSLMRTGPVGLAAKGDLQAVADTAARISALTHAQADAVDACVLWSSAIARALDLPVTGPVAIDWVAHVARGLDHLPRERRGRWEQRLDACRTATPETFDRNGWVVHALQAALAVLAQTPVPTEGPACRHLQLVIERAVRLGGDTDTVAAITGSLAGARWGATAVPHRWRRTLHGHPRRGEAAWRWGDLERTARLALDGGSTDSAGWPSVASMLPHYAEANPAAPRRVPLDDLVAVGNVHALPEVLAEVDAVVSLCRMGTRDVPSGIEHQVIGFHDTDPRDNPNLDFVLADTADLLGTLAAEGRRTFVHCVQAQHRTPAVGAAYLVRRHGLSPDEALDRVASRVGSRPQSFQVDAVRRLART